MAITLPDGTVLRNLEEQVLKNKQDIAQHYAVDRVLADFGIIIVGTLTSEYELPDPTTYTGAYGDAYAIGVAPNYTYYIFTRPDPNSGHLTNWWMDIGNLAIEGPRGEQGPAGPRGPEGYASHWYVARAVPASGDYTEGDMLLIGNTGSNQNGQVYRYTANSWVFVTNILGPKGIQGPIGPQGVQGPVGPRGFKGEPGVPGSSVTIVNVLNNTSQLPTPTEAIRNNAYLIPVNGVNHIYIITKNANDALVWKDVGSFAVGGSKIYVNGQEVSTFDADTKLNAITSTSTSDAFRLYAVTPEGEQSTLKSSSEIVNGAVVERTTNGNILVPAAPTGSNAAVSKSYVDASVSNLVPAPANAPRTESCLAVNEYGESYYIDVADPDTALNNGTPAPYSIIKTNSDGAVPARRVPIDDNEAASKAYVDSVASGGGGGGGGGFSKISLDQLTAYCSGTSKIGKMVKFIDKATRSSTNRSMTGIIVGDLNTARSCIYANKICSIDRDAQQIVMASIIWTNSAHTVQDNAFADMGGVFGFMGGPLEEITVNMFDVYIEN